MNHLILVRHGQSIWNLEKRFTGWVDIELTDQGKLEACQAGKLIKKLDLKINSFFCSYQKRAINTLDLIVNTIHSKPNQITKAWELNERHYGELTGLNKDQMKKVYGEKKIHIFRRSWNMSPAPLNKNNPYHPLNIEIYKNIPRDKIPDTESLKNTYERVIYYYLKNIEPLIQNGQNVLISAHGNTLRALCKKLFNISDKNIARLEIPTGNPLLIKFKNNLKINGCRYLDSSRSKDLLVKF
jgi:2,3-bisphosphoglycerate-dependent phosphoglycerate mutase